MPPFNVQRCARKTVYCGNARALPKAPSQGRPNFDAPAVYTRYGSRFECMKKGYGAGAAIEKNKHLPPNDVQNVMYIGDRYAQRLDSIMNIKTFNDLRGVYNRKTSKSSFDAQLKRVFVNSKMQFDTRPYNALLAWMYYDGLDMTGFSCKV